VDDQGDDEVGAAKTSVVPVPAEEDTTGQTQPNQSWEDVEGTNRNDETNVCGSEGCVHF
jgi:hypothetical protein